GQACRNRSYHAPLGNSAVTNFGNRSTSVPATASGFRSGARRIAGVRPMITGRAPASPLKSPTLVPGFPKFVTHGGTLLHELRKRTGTSKLMILVPLFDLKFLDEIAAGGAGTSNRRHQCDRTASVYPAGWPQWTTAQLRWGRALPSA